MVKKGLSDKTLEHLRNAIENQAAKIAEDFKNEMSNEYNSLIDRFYNEPYKTNPPHYKRTGNLRKSIVPYFAKNGNSVCGGIIIGNERMSDYENKYGHTYHASALLSDYIYNPGHTWHGGDYHGGYGVPASFSIYNEIGNFYRNTVKKYRNEFE